MSKIESIADNFVAAWCKDDSVKDEFKNELIEMIADIHKEYIIASISNEVCGESLHSQYTKVMKEFVDLKKQLKMFNEENMQSIEQTRRELSEQLSKNIKKPAGTTSSASTLGLFGSVAAKKFAEDNNIDPNTVIATGKGGKITKKDIEKAMGSSVAKVSKTSKQPAVSKKYCNGITASGDACKSEGKQLVNGSWYCNRHKEQGNKCANIADDEQFDSYVVEGNNKLVIDRFRDSSIKSLESVDDSDIKLNEIIDDDSDNESPKKPVKKAAKKTTKKEEPKKEAKKEVKVVSPKKEDKKPKNKLQQLEDSSDEEIVDTFSDEEILDNDEIVSDDDIEDDMEYN